MHGLAARDEGHALARHIIKARHDDHGHGQLVLREELRRRTGAREHDDGLTFWNYAGALHEDEGATPDDLRESVATLEEVERIARRALGSAHPSTHRIERCLERSRAALRAHESRCPDFLFPGPLIFTYAAGVVAWVWLYFFTNELD